jgi:hypothetical protein
MRYTWTLIICLVLVIITNYFCFILFIKEKNSFSYLYDHQTKFDLIHFEKLYPSLSKEEELTIKKQEAIGICVNFNFNPDQNGNTLGSILPFYTRINKYVVILTPYSFNRLSNRNLQLFDQFNVTSISIDNQTSNFSFVNHIECAHAGSGQFQHKCLLLCAQFYALVKVKHSNLQGILYLADDLYFNFGYVFSHPERFSLDEIWSTPWLQVVDIITNDKGRLGNTWSWWKIKPHLWNSFRDLFFSTSNTSEKYREIFQILYGSNKRLAVGIADLLYLPFADNQLTNLISITNELMTILPSDIFCEIIFSLVVDTTMSISGHWPFENDRLIYNSSINRLNNLEIIQQMEKINLIKNGHDPYSLNNSFRQRPCLFNPDGFIWDHHRQNRQLYQTAIINGTVPITYLLEPWPYTTEFIHPIKLSNADHWSFQLWHQGMKQQIQLIKIYQKNKRRIY